jgi:CRP-like cAMP-binding protein
VTSAAHETPADAPADERARVRAACERPLRAGEVVFDPGDACTGLVVVRSGYVELVAPDPAAGGGSGGRTVARHGPGEAVGEADLLLGRPRALRAVAVTDARVLEVDAATARRMLLERPEIALHLLARATARAAELERRLSALGMDDLVRPLVRALLAELGAAAEGTRIGAPLRALAAASGLALRDAHRALQELFERKLVRLVDDGLLVVDRTALAACLGEARASLTPREAVR